MRGLAADIPDQTRQPATQSRTLLVGHRQLPWIHVAPPRLMLLLKSSADDAD
jgi:hypothetical protein